MSTSYLNEHNKYRRLEEEIARLREALAHIAEHGSGESERVAKDALSVAYAPDSVGDNDGYDGHTLAAKDREIARLREALEPYFQHWDWQARGHSELSSIWTTIHTPATHKQHQDARAALSGAPAPSERGK